MAFKHKLSLWIVLLGLPFTLLLSADEAPKKESLKEEMVTTSNTVTIDGAAISYKATTGTLLLKDELGTIKGAFFFVAYNKDGVDDLSKRPITFCFNGGPGSSSVWLHMGAFGPRRLDIDDLNPSLAPYTILDNNYSILDATDLVFIDPISTGYSVTSPGVDAKTYHGFDEDVKSVGEFIRLYVTKFRRWDSPKFLAGESYGTTRAVGLLDHLDDQSNMVFNGVILISNALNYQTLWDYQGGNDLPYILSLPSFTSAAWYHHRLPEDLQKNLSQAVEESESFALNEYTLALMQGDRLDPQQKDRIVDKLSRLTGLSRAYILRSNLRVGVTSFTQELLKDQLRTIGRFDSRMKGIDYDPLMDQMAWDPSFHLVMGPFTATFNQYVRTELKWEKDEQYKILSNLWPWDFGKNNQFLNISVSLNQVMSKNPLLQVFVASGQYDLATPYYTNVYTFDHLGIDPALKKNIRVVNYPSGHMMYLSKPNMAPFKKDIKDFINNAYKH